MKSHERGRAMSSPSAELRPLAWGRFSALAAFVALLGCGARTAPHIAPPAPACVEVPSGPEAVRFSLRSEPALLPVDVVVAYGMGGRGLSDTWWAAEQAVADISEAVFTHASDPRVGLFTFTTFPECFERWLEPGTPSRPGQHVFEIVTPLTTDPEAMVSGASSLSGLWSPRGAAIEALYQLTTPEGLAPWVPPASCSGGEGQLCLRPEALPVVLLLPGAPIANGPEDINSYAEICPEVADVAHAYDETVAALRALGVRVLGFHDSDDEWQVVWTLRHLATDTQTVGADGEPMVFDIGRNGEHLGAVASGAIARLNEELPFDVDTLLVDPDPSDGVDPRTFVEAVEATRAEPAHGIEGLDRSRGIFFGVRGHTRLFFDLVLRNPGIGPGRFPLDIVLRADGRFVLGTVRVEIVVPDTTGLECGE